MTTPSPHDPAATGWAPRRRDPGWSDVPFLDATRRFHRGLEGYAPTPLVDLPALAAELGVGRVLAKCESDRFGLPSFKALGASWAVHTVVADHPAGDEPLTVVCATEGNHGRAVAHFARRFGHRSVVVIPAGVGAPAVEAIAAEGAVIRRVDGDYDVAVAEAAALSEAGAGHVLVQDTAWDGYTRVPGAVVEGYSTLFHEVDEQLGAAGPADLVIVPTGVGSLLHAALRHHRAAGRDQRTAVVAVEPTVAAALPASFAADRPVTVETGSTVMAGLNCGTPSALTWPAIRHGLDAATAVTDAEAVAAGHDFRALGVDAGPCGAASLAGARLIADAEERRAHLGLGPTSTVVLLVTEGTRSNPLPAHPTAPDRPGADPAAPAETAPVAAHRRPVAVRAPSVRPGAPSPGPP